MGSTVSHIAVSALPANGKTKCGWTCSAGHRRTFFGPEATLKQKLKIINQRESNMHRYEGHHFASPFAPPFPGGGKQWTHAGDPKEVVGFPIAKVDLLAPEKRQFVWGKGGGEGDTNGNHEWVHVLFSLN